MLTLPGCKSDTVLQSSRRVWSEKKLPELGVFANSGVCKRGILSKGWLGHAGDVST
jgi:hypothetical protein